MSNDVDPQIIRNTQQILTKFIKKPALTEKLLRKPPFRFLHDIVNSVIRETGFLKGLYSERELASENVKEKDDKVAFLNKLIDATKAITGSNLAVRSTRIVAGLEPTETNVLLQAIGTALDKKLDSSPYITQLKSKNKSKTHINAPESDRKSKSDKTKDKTVKSKDKQGDKPKIPSTPTSKSQKQTGEVKKTSDKVKVNKNLTSKNSKESAADDSKLKTQSKTTKPKAQTPREKTVAVEHVVKKEVNENKREIINQVSIDNEEQKLKIEEQSNELNIIKHQQFDTDNKEKLLQSDLPIPTENIKTPIERVKSAKPKSERLKREKSTTKIILEPSDSKELLENEKISIEQPLLNVEDNVPQLEVQDLSSKPSDSPPSDTDKSLHTGRPRSSLRPPSVRPSSARPGAPRLRNELALPEGEVVPLGKVNVIIENFNNKEIDEEETVTIQAAPEPELQLPILQLPTDKGHLVEQILEQINQDDVAEHTKPTINIEWEQDGLRNRNAANKEIEQLKSAIQTLTRTANPLGKLVNYLHEDIEAMHSELDMWINSARQILAEVANQKRISDESNKPLQGQLEEIEDSITKHQQQIVSAYGNILRNEQRIKDLIK